MLVQSYASIVMFLLRYHECMRYNPDYTKIYTNCAHLYKVHTKEYDLAIAMYEKCIELDPAKFSAYNGLAGVYKNGLKDYAKARPRKLCAKIFDHFFCFLSTREDSRAQARLCSIFSCVLSLYYYNCEVAYNTLGVTL